MAMNPDGGKRNSPRSRCLVHAHAAAHGSLELFNCSEVPLPTASAMPCFWGNSQEKSEVCYSPLLSMARLTSAALLFKTWHI